jgi:PAS domain S-box-containing protein
MVSDENEEKLLRSVSLQNAQSILAARQRAEQELVQAKEALELTTKELAQSLATMRATLESTSDGILATDGGDKVTGFNQKYIEMWRIPLEVLDSREHSRLLEVCGRQFNSPEQFRGRVEDIYTSSPPESYDLLELLDGRVFERFSQIQRIDALNVGRVWSFRDITTRRHAEQALQKESEWLRVTLASIGDAVIITDAAGRVSSLNPVAESITGWTKQEAQGKPLNVVFRIINEQSRELVENPATRALREGRIVGLANHTILIAKDGTERALDDSAAPIRDDRGNVIGVVLIFRDVTEARRAAEAQLRLSAIVESSDDAIISKTLDGIIVSWNQGAERLYVYTAKEVVGKPLSILIPPDHPDELPEIMERLKRGERIENYETTRLRKDGSRVDVSLTISPVRGTDGKIIGASKIARDITASKRADEALRDSEARKTAILETALDSIITCDHQGLILEFNSAAERTFGFQRANVMGRDMADLIVPHRLRDRHRRGMAHYLATGDGPILNRRIEMPALRGDGTEFPVELAITRIPGKGLPMFTAYLRDLTDRKRAEELLQKQSERLRVTLASIGDAVITTDGEGRIHTLNGVAESMTGWTEQEAQGMPLNSVFHIINEQSRELVENPATRALREGRIVALANHTVLIAKDNKERSIDDSAAPIRDDQGNVMGVVLIFRDITEKREKEERLRQSEQTARFLANASATLAELADYESTLQKVASLAVPFFADWCAVDMHDANGSVRRLAVTHVEPAKVALAHELDRRYPPSPSDAYGVMKVLRSGQPEWAAEIPDSLLVESAHDQEHLRLVRALGLKSYICVPLKSRVKTLGVLTFVMAESSRVYDTDDLQAAEDLANRAVIAIENASLLATLKESDRSKDEFLAMLAHELRNPLAPIQNAVEVLRLRGKAVPELPWATEVIDRQARQMTRLVDDLLDVSRITRGKIELRKERIELAMVVNSALEASRPLVEKRGHELTVTVPHEPIYFEADPTRLAQVLSNLLNNAARYTDQGGRIWLTAEQQGAQVSIRVTDTGIGIPTEMLSRIFEMFVQVDRSLERSQSGLGIGLTLVQRLVAMHGGTVEAHSAGLGKGSEIVLRLPIAVEAEVRVGREEGEGHKALAPFKGRVLVVDDNQDAVDGLEILLRMMGNQVYTAHDGVEGVRAAAEFRPDVVLLDIGLPKLNGYDAARRIREHPGGSEMVLIALTGWGQEEDRRRSKEAGFDHHLTKPVDFDALQELLAGLKPTGRRDLGY